MMTEFARRFLHSIGLKSKWEDVRPGDRLMHPEHGEITIIDGQYWGHRGVSNFWHWEDKNGKEHHGYGLWEL